MNQPGGQGGGDKDYLDKGVLSSIVLLPLCGASTLIARRTGADEDMARSTRCGGKEIRRGQVCGTGCGAEESGDE